MSSMSISLNNRHKAGLFLTTVVAGLGLIMGETFRQTSGAIVIGLALTWAFGSAIPVIRYCIGGIGVLLFFAPFVAVLTDHHEARLRYEESLKSFRLQLPEFAKEHPDLSSGLAAKNIPNLPPGAILVPTQRTFSVPNLGNIEFPSNMSSRDIAAALRADKGPAQPPDWYYEALDAGIDPTQMDWLAIPIEKPIPLNIWHAFTDGIVFEIPSALLAFLFFGSSIFDRKQSIEPSNQIL